jgi:hypothetical protein
MPSKSKVTAHEQFFPRKAGKSYFLTGIKINSWKAYQAVYATSYEKNVLNFYILHLGDGSTDLGVEIYEAILA